MELEHAEVSIEVTPITAQFVRWSVERRFTLLVKIDL
jgi:hypothetical protein